MKIILKKISANLINILSKKISNTFVGDQFIASLSGLNECVRYKNFDLLFCTPNRLMSYRATSFSDKEPETLEWIDSFKEGSVVWDIGANVGLYSVYAAKSKSCKVYAFEPSVFNLEFLARNISLNNLENLIAIIPIALSPFSGVNKLLLSTIEWGGALSTFEKNISWDGGKIKDVFSYQTLGMSMDDFLNIPRISKPDYIKIDVDGLEHYILGGGKCVLKFAKEILVEVNDGFEEQSSEVSNILTEHGFQMTAKKHSDAFNGTIFEQTYNQIWSKVCK